MDPTGCPQRPSNVFALRDSLRRVTALRDAIRAASGVLADAGVTGPDVELLAAFALGASASDVRLAMARGDEIADDALARLDALVARRARREPLQHITGVAHFRRLELRVGDGVFVPRPETEVLVDHVLALLREAPADALVVDAGTGSGAIAIAIATERPGTRVTAIEASPAAFAYARANIAALAPSVRLLHADFAAAPAELDGTVDVLVSNPPYVPDAAVPRDPEVRLHDPRLALYGGADGLDAVRALAARGRDLVRARGAIALEHGELQGAEVRSTLAAHGWQQASTSPDLTGRDRVTIARR